MHYNKNNKVDKSPRPKYEVTVFYKTCDTPNKDFHVKQALLKYNEFGGPLLYVSGDLTNDNLLGGARGVFHTSGYMNLTQLRLILLKFITSEEPSTDYNGVRGYYKNLIRTVLEFFEEFEGLRRKECIATRALEIALIFQDIWNTIYLQWKVKLKYNVYLLAREAHETRQANDVGELHQPDWNMIDSIFELHIANTFDHEVNYGGRRRKRGGGY